MAFSSYQPRWPGGSAKGGRWKPGASEFRKLSNAEAIQHDTDGYLAQGYDKDSAGQMARSGNSDGFERWVSTAGTEVAFRGDISDTQKREAMNVAEDLVSTTPHPVEGSKVKFHLDASDDGGGAMGRVQYESANHASIYGGAADGSQQPAFKKAVSEGRFSQYGEDVSVTRYAMTHEYGHMIDRGNDPRKKSLSILDQVSTYASANPDEGFAESFAEWHLSGGKTTNSVSKAFAKLEGWGTPDA